MNVYDRDGREWCCPNDTGSAFPKHVLNLNLGGALVCETCNQPCVTTKSLKPAGPTNFRYGGKVFRCERDNGTPSHRLGYMEKDDTIWCQTCNLGCPLCATCGCRVIGSTCRCTSVPRGCRRCAASVGSAHKEGCSLVPKPSYYEPKLPAAVVSQSDTEIPGAVYMDPPVETSTLPKTSCFLCAAGERPLHGGSCTEPPVVGASYKKVATVPQCTKCGSRHLLGECRPNVPPVTPTKPEAVDHPAHYGKHPSGVECITVVECLGFNIGNVIKYCWRADEKGHPIEDLEKAAWYLAREIKRRKAV